MLVTDKEKKVEVKNEKKSNCFIRFIKSIPNTIVGFAFIVVGIYACVVSTSASLVPIEAMYTGDRKTTMASMYLVIQVGAFLANLFKNYIYKVAPQHYKLINTMARLLLVVSVCSTIAFLTQSQMDTKTFDKNMETISDLYNLLPFLDLVPFYTWIIKNTTNIIFIYIICVLLDVIGINLPQIGLDMMLGINVKTKKIEKSLIFMLWNNFWHERVKNVKDKYYKNNRTDIKINVDNSPNVENNTNKINGKNIVKLLPPKTEIDNKTDKTNKKINNNKKVENLETVNNREKNPTRQAKENHSKKDYNVPTGKGQNNNKTDTENTVKKYLETLKNNGEKKIVVNKLLENCNIKKDKWQDIRNKFDKEDVVNYDKKSKITYIT